MKQHIYFVGIGGIGMSALARYFKAKGFIVSGSDAARSVITDALVKEGISVVIGHKKTGVSHTKQIAFVVYNRAIAPTNPELIAARALGVPVVPYANILGELTEEYNTIAITGSHGKSTTTALAALTLIQGGLDPTVLIGTNLNEFNGNNIRIGKSSYLVLEADDFGAAFLAYSPTISIVTNIDREHLDFYKTFSGVKNGFLKFMERTQDGGALILNRDNANLFSLKDRIDSIAKKKSLKVIWYSLKNPNVAAVKKNMNISGEHNLSNAMAVYELGKLLKISERKIIRAIGSYTGAWRRMEFRGEISSIKVFDDYAHHPTEIKATLQAFREKFPRAPLVCVFQPHQTKRLEALFKEFVSAFNDASALILLPLYSVAGRDQASSKFTARYLAGAISKKYPERMIFYTENPKHIQKTLRTVLDFFPPSPAPVVIMMGAGNIVQYTDILIGAK